MPNTSSKKMYRYSGNLGLLIKQFGEIKPYDLEYWSETDDQALIKYYQEEKLAAHKQIQAAKDLLENHNEILIKLENDFGWLKEKFPEEFI